MAAPAHDISQIFLELGAAIVGLAVLARLANRFGFSAIPFYLLAGLAFGNGGLAPLDVSQSFIHTGAEIGVLLLLFMLGVEYTAKSSSTICVSDCRRASSILRSISRRG
jgi:CPA2 family monovalent cation:H+ antiporter-2